MMRRNEDLHQQMLEGMQRQSDDAFEEARKRHEEIMSKHFGELPRGLNRPNTDPAKAADAGKTAGLNLEKRQP